jgi:cob(I)alamin adenosyltransferase
MSDARALSPGLVQVYTGDGKGKTTAAVGLGVRAAGHGLRVFLLQFMKGDPNYGELLALKSIPNFDFLQSGLPTFVEKGNPSSEDLRLAAAGLARAEELLAEGNYDVIILDEINCAVDYGLIAADDVLQLIERKPPHVELVLTGRNAPREVLMKADLVSEVLEIRHPFQRGIRAREGIEH